MTFISKTAAVFGLTAIALGAFAAVPASAQHYHSHYRHTYHPVQRHQATRLDQQAAHAAHNGNYRRAARLRAHAYQLRHAANHGY